jgi:ribonuclease P protein component
VAGLRRAVRLRASADFAAVRSQGRTLHFPTLMLGWRANDLTHNQYGFVVGKRVGNAVTRNLVKRRLRAIIQQMQSEIATGYAVVITAKPAAARRTFVELQGDVRQALKRAKLWSAGKQNQTTPTDVSSAHDPQEGSA